MKKIFAKNVKWDLTDIYKDLDDPKIAENEQRFKSWVKTFNSEYKDDFTRGNISAESLANAIKERERFGSETSIHRSYFYLRQSQNQLDDEVNKSVDRVDAFFSELSAQTLWFSLSINKLPEKKIQKLLLSPLLKNYRYFLTELRKFRKYQLSEKEEQVIVKKDQTGASAFVQLYDRLDGMREFEIFHNGKKQRLNYNEIQSIASDSDNRKVRRKASDVINEKFKQDSRINAFILNTLIQDSKIEREMRGYKFPQQPTLLSYGIERKTLESLVSAVTAGYPICERYYKTKTKTSGLKTLYEWDRYNRPFKIEKEDKYSWEDAKKIVLDAFGSLDPKFRNIANDFFKNNWIDAQVSPGKSSGGYCLSPSPKHHPYIFMNYTGAPRDVMTLAHELGHGIHNVLSSKQSFVNYHSSTAVAEIASIFCEGIVFDSLYQKTNDPLAKMNMLANRIQSSFATVFRQIAFYLFESDIHTHRLKQGTLSVEQLNEYFMKRLQAMFRKGLTLTKDHGYLWGVVSHFYWFNFYVFAYSMGELLTLSLMAEYRREGKSFLNGYIQALETGGSANPYDITKMMGVDISDKKFWDGGIRLLDELVREFELLSDTYNRQ
ncbi:M3 family oligoendopeptidase [Candidatus Nomurabacteria bacterium]|nr:M3 family oligoendopeptidase [Candidatus Nomurabacteria bacterium]